MDAVDEGKITLDDKVTISERAASMGGSQMYMEPGETHTVAQLMELNKQQAAQFQAMMSQFSANTNNGGNNKTSKNKEQWDLDV